jgi:tetratricopeptide (TPR) repeat protein
MDCKDVEERDILEQYLLDRLTDSERDEFEKHYFECASCFSRIQTGLAVQTGLERQPELPAKTRAVFWGQPWSWTPAFVSVALLFALGIWWYAARNSQSSQQVSPAPPTANFPASAQSQPPAPAAATLEALARVEPPPYAPVVLRGAEDEAHATFRKAMQYYLKGEYAKAIPGLRAAVKASPQIASFNFYLGACYLLTDQTDSAIESFRRTVSIGAPSYSEQAHYYLAKAYLREKDVPAAKEEVQETIRFHGSKEAEAQEILSQLHK